jgi:hypothetical protein
MHTVILHNPDPKSSTHFVQNVEQKKLAENVLTFGLIGVIIKAQRNKEEPPMKNAILAYLLNTYIDIAYTHSYIFGYSIKGMIYAARVMDARPILPYLAILDHASGKNGGTYSAKFRQNSERIGLITAAACEIRPICTVDYMEQMFHNSPKNRGDLFEDMVAEVFNMKQMDSRNAKFTDCGDVVAADGIHYQVKFNKATFTDEKTLHNLMAAK